jgi:hypothetical protein
MATAHRMNEGRWAGVVDDMVSRGAQGRSMSWIVSRSTWPGTSDRKRSHRPGSWLLAARPLRKRWQRGRRRWVAAYDVNEGHEIWRFYTAPTSADQPEARTWAGDAWKHGGSTIWVTGSYDPDTNLTFWGTGNPNPGRHELVFSVVQSAEQFSLRHKEQPHPRGPYR